MLSGITTGVFATTLMTRPALSAGCNPNLTTLTSPTHSHAQMTCSNGMTPGFWAQHPTCWPSTISPDDTFSRWFGSKYFPYSGETLRKALCAPNGADNLAFQIGAGLLNAESEHTNPYYGYGSAQVFANAVIAAFKATNNNYGRVHDLIAAMNQDGDNSHSWCGNGGDGICK